MLNESPITAVVPCTDFARAKNFYTETLGLKVEKDFEGQGAVFAGGKGTTLMVYPTKFKGSEATAVSWLVDDIKTVMKELKSKGVIFEEYDLPGLKTVDGVAEMDGMKSAWFKDPDGNILNINQM